LILVVDDGEANRDLLREILELDGHRVSVASDGPEALRGAREEAPDLVLLDVNMPGIDGLEVCRRLRADTATASLPIILVTALADRTHRLEGIAAGANDYLTKPIDRPDLLLRVRNALRLRKLHNEIAAQFRKLQELEQMRDSLVHMLVHDLRGPLTGISVSLQMSEERIVELGDSELSEDFAEMSRSVTELTDMVSDVLDVSRFEADAMPMRPAAVDLRTVVADVVGALGRGGHASVVLHAAPQPVVAVVDPDLIRRVVGNLVGNAVKFTPRGGEVRVEVGDGTGGPEIRVSDTGPGISPEFHERIFEKFGQANGNGAARGRSSGLGLAYCKLAVLAHGGRIGVLSEPGRGSTFWLTLPGSI
jgi:signal transduction histidine kinase